MVLVRIILSVIAAVVVFILVFLAIFVPMLIHDTHVAPHDGQGGMSGAFVGLPIATLAALATAPAFYLWLKRRGLFSN